MIIDPPIISIVSIIHVCSSINILFKLFIPKILAEKFDLTLIKSFKRVIFTLKSSIAESYTFKLNPFMSLVLVNNESIIVEFVIVYITKGR